MATPLDPKQLARRAREQRAREAAEEKAQLDRRVVEAGDYTLMGAVVERLTRSGESFDCASLASQLDSEPDWCVARLTWRSRLAPSPSRTGATARRNADRRERSG